MRILVAGATGTIGSRLVPRLLDGGHDVVALTRNRARVSARPWHDRVTVVEGDAADSVVVTRAMDGVDTVVHLVHAMESGIRDFAASERRTADTVAAAAELVGVRHVVYLGGLSQDADTLSPHLSSRVRTGAQLASYSTPVTELRASVVLGRGSASYELIRFVASTPFTILVQPTWATALCQPIAMPDMLDLLVGAVVEGPGAQHRIVEVGGPDVGAYTDLVDVLRDLDSGLPTVQARVPTVLSPTVVGRLVSLLTPVDPDTVAPLVASLQHDSVVDPARGHEVAVMPTSVVQALESCLAGVGEYAAMPGDPDWVGATLDADLVVDIATRLPSLPQRLLGQVSGAKLLGSVVTAVNNVRGAA